MPLGSNLPPSDKTEFVAASIGIVFDREGSFWISTIGFGMLRVAHPQELAGRSYDVASQALDRRVETFTSREGLTDATVTAILEDREGNIWAGTNVGLDCFRKGNLAPFVSPIPLVQTMLSARDGGRMSIFSGDRIIDTGQADQSTISTVPELKLYAYRDPKGVVWWSGNGYASRVQAGHIVRIPPKTAKAPFRLFPLLTEDFDGVVWGAVQYEGIFYLKDDVWRRLATSPEIAQSDPTAAFTDGTGRVWFGFGSGGALVVIEKNTLRVVTPNGQSPVGHVVTSIQGRGHHLWIGGAKLVYFDGNSFHEVIPFDSDAFNVCGIEEISDGSLWLCENRGVIHIPAPEVRKFLTNFSARVHYELYDSADGLPGSFHDATARTREVEGTDGRLWFVATKGVAWLDPAAVSRNLLPPPVAIRFVDADGKQYKAGNDLEFPPRVANLRIAYTALSLSVPSRVRFRYKLEGIDRDWQDPGTRREAFYTRPGPGKYLFRVIACNNDGVWNDAGTSLAFLILPAYYQTIWFQIVCLSAGLVLLWALYQLRVRHLQRQYAIGLEARVNERTRIARELHDTLLQTFSASLLRFQSVSKMLPARPEEAKQRVENAIEQASAAIAEGRDAVHQLRIGGLASGDLAEPIKSFLSELIGSTERQNPPEVRVHVEGAPRDLSPTVRDEVYRIATEALRNALRYASATAIEVDIRYSDRHLRLRVRDNGIGMESSVLESGRLPGHWGLHGMRERAHLLGANLELWSQVNSGTEVELTVPAAKAYLKPASRWSIFASRWSN
jgi:signal transduction histidine kinase